MLQDRIIKESTSPRSKCTVAVPKADGMLRLCNYFRKLSDISDFDCYMSRVDDLIDHLGSA